MKTIRISNRFYLSAPLDITDHPTRHPHRRCPCGHRLIDQSCSTDYCVFTDHDIMTSCDGGAHTDVCTILDHDAIMPLFASVASEVDAIRDGHVVTNHYLIHAQVVQITLHPDEAPTPYLKTAQPIQCDPYWCQHTVRSNVLANALTHQVPHLSHQRPLIPIRHVLALRFGMTKAVEKG